MQNADEIIGNLKKYIKRLSTAVTNEAVFNLGGTKLLNKARIDDLLCCIEATFPQEYKTYGKNITAKKLRSKQAWQELNTALKKKFFLNGDLYIIKTNEVIGSIQVFQKTIDPDIRFIYSEESGMTF